MSKRQKDERDGRKRLERAGWQINKSDRLNNGSETARHLVAKTLVGHHLSHELGYRVAFEVTHPERGEIDCLAYGLPDRISPYAVECETAPTKETVEHKLERYHKGTPIQEVLVINVNDMPERVMEAYKWVSQNI